MIELCTDLFSVSQLTFPKPGEKLAFASGSTLNPAAAVSSETLSAAGEAARAAAAALVAKPGVRKSKWGAQEGGDEPEAKRPHA